MTIKTINKQSIRELTFFLVFDLNIFKNLLCLSVVNKMSDLENINSYKHSV